MCTQVNAEDFETVHHEMGHIQYYMQYRHQANLFRSGANAAFHEAIGDTVALSVATMRHLYAVQLSDIDPDTISRGNLPGFTCLLRDSVCYCVANIIIIMPSVLVPSVLFAVGWAAGRASDL